MKKHMTIGYRRILNLLLAIGLISFFQSSFASTFVVTSINDTGEGSFRHALVMSNTQPGEDSITFNIPGPGPHELRLKSPLPKITETVVINGYSQPGSELAGFQRSARLMICLKGGYVSSESGLRVQSNRVILRGLSISEFSANGVDILGNNNQIVGNQIGFCEASPAGADAGYNGLNGISVQGNENRIGSDTLADRNVISASGLDGIRIVGDSNQIQNNFIGLDSTGSQPRGNTKSGVRVHGDYNVIGAEQGDQRNVIADNQIGIHIGSGRYNRVLGNFVGTSSKGTVVKPFDLGNRIGVLLDSGRNSIGGTERKQGNVIANNLSEGVIVNGHQNIVVNNRIGVDISATQALPNAVGIIIHGNQNRIGGVLAGDSNIISGNDSVGILIEPALGFAPERPSMNLVQGNLIGVDGQGNQALGNGADGILIIDATANTIGGSALDAGNIIAGNGDDGVEIRSFAHALSASNNRVYANFIGTNKTGDKPLGNLGNGVRITRGYANQVGDRLDVLNNTIKYNNRTPIQIEKGVENKINGVTVAKAAKLEANHAAITVTKMDYP